MQETINFNVPLTDHQKIDIGIKEIAQMVRDQLKKEYPTCVFSVTIERYSMGQSLHVSLMKSDFKVIRDSTDINENALRHLSTGYTIEDIKQRQNERYHQLNQYGFFRDEYDPDTWNNGVFLTEKAHIMFKRIVKIVNYFNWDNSDSQTDYFDVHFYLHLNIGKWNKPYVQEAI